jgi:hypothetical protein
MIVINSILSELAGCILLEPPALLAITIAAEDSPNHIPAVIIDLVVRRMN